MKKPRRVVAALIVMLGAAALIAAGTVTAKSHGKKAAPFKVAWIYPGPARDGGWSQAHDDGRLYV